MADNEDLGLGARVAQENKSRFVNHDGSFNVFRKGVLEHGAFSPYHASLSMSWSKFYIWMLWIFLFINIFFTALYFTAGVQGFPSLGHAGYLEKTGQLFLFSIQTIVPLGSSFVVPATMFAEILVAFEAIVGILGFAVAAALIFARFSNPAANIIFSNQAVIAPYNGITGFMVRIINGRSNELINAEATMTISLNDKNGKRVFRRADLERDKVLVFPLSWTVVHPITKESPLYGLSLDEINKASVEVVVAFTAIDQDLSKSVFARASYVDGEIMVGRKFANILETTPDGTVFVDPGRVHEIEGLPG